MAMVRTKNPNLRNDHPKGSSPCHRKKWPLPDHRSSETENQCQGRKAKAWQAQDIKAPG
jgi:hypothetical protein